MNVIPFMPSLVAKRTRFVKPSVSLNSGFVRNFNHKIFAKSLALPIPFYYNAPISNRSYKSSKSDKKVSNKLKSLILEEGDTSKILDKNLLQDKSEPIASKLGAVSEQGKTVRTGDSFGVKTLKNKRRRSEPQDIFTKRRKRN